MYNKLKLSTVSSIIIIAVAIGLGYLLSINAKNNPKNSSKSINSGITTSNNNNFDWNTVSTEEFNQVFTKDGFYSPGQFSVHLIKEVDINGDGQTEAIVQKGVGTAIYDVLSRNKDGSIYVMKQKNKDGSISNAILSKHSATLTSSEYELIPEEKGYYAMVFELDEERSTDKEIYYNCIDNSINAYSWNSLLKLFVWNKDLTEKYTKHTEELLKTNCASPSKIK